MSKKLAEEYIEMPDMELHEKLFRFPISGPGQFRQFLRDVIRDSYLKGVRKTREGCAEAVSSLREPYSCGCYFCLKTDGVIRDAIDRANKACLSYRDELEES